MAESWLPTVAQSKWWLPIGLLVLFWCWETWHPFLEQRKGRFRHGFRNLLIALINTAFLAVTFGVITVTAAQWTAQSQLGLLNLVALPFGVNLVLGMVLLDGWMYLWHRANHAIPFLWRFHRMHHSDPAMDVTTATRFHLGEHVISATLRLMLIPILGLGIWHIVAYELLLIPIIQLHHSNVSLGRLDRWLNLLIVTPNMHKVHHSRWRVETDSNYSSILSVWDRIAKTFRVRREPSTIEFGLTEFDDPSWQTAWGMLRTPLASRCKGRASEVRPASGLSRPVGAPSAHGAHGGR